MHPNTRVSRYFKLNFSQAELDFVDVRISRDMRLFIDPYAISIRDDDWSQLCQEHIISFFEEVLDSVRRDDRAKGEYLLSKLSEPNETRLGLSSGAPQGRGIGASQALDIYRAFFSSDAAKSGLLSDLSESTLFIDGIGHDKISDLTTNILRGPLIRYTKEQCLLFGIPMQDTAPGPTWNHSKRRWQSSYEELPVVSGRILLLVPKYSVRLRVSLDSQEMYNSQIVPYLQAENLSSNSSLVEVLKNGRRRVTKKSIKEEYPFSKDFVSDFLQRHQHLLDIYKKTADEAGPLKNDLIDDEIIEPEIAISLKNQLKSIRPGSADAGKFHQLMVGLLEFLFYPNLIYPFKEKEIHDGRKRIDIQFTNSAESGFFNRAHSKYSIPCGRIHVECKNYSQDIANEELDQISGRFSPNRGKLGLVIARKFRDRKRFVRRCRDTAQDDRGFVIPLVDSDVVKMLDAVIAGQRSEIDKMLDQIYSELVN